MIYFLQRIKIFVIRLNVYIYINDSGHNSGPWHAYIKLHVKEWVFFFLPKLTINEAIPLFILLIFSNEL